MPDHTQHAGHAPPAQPAPAQKEKTAQAHAGMSHAGKEHAPGMMMAHGETVWPHFANMILGLWLVTGVFALGYRSAALQVSDAVSGALVIVLAILSVSRWKWFKFWAPWANSLVGLWSALRAARLLGAHVRGLRQRHARRRAGRRVRHPGAGDADGTGDEHGARPGRAAGLVVQPFQLAAAGADHRARARRVLPVAADDFLPAPVHHVVQRSVLRTRHGARADL